MGGSLDSVSSDGIYISPEGCVRSQRAAAHARRASALTEKKREVNIMVKDHGPQIKDDERYEKLREKGVSKQKAARIANTPRSEAGRRGGKSPRYEDWNRDDLYEKAKQVGIKGRSRMPKSQLIEALRRGN
jgi:hypothetical protein